MATRRRLTAILSADVAGFSRLMEADEAGTHRRLLAARQITDALIDRHEGRIVGTAGDSLLAEFPSVVQAVTCAIAIQTGLAERDTGERPEERLEFRIGINLGDVIVDGAEVYGDGVNIAARIQAMAAPGGITVSAAVHQQVRGKLNVQFRDLGRHHVKNIAEPVHILAIATQSGPASSRRGRLAEFSWRWVASGLLVVAIALGGLWLTLSLLQDYALRGVSDSAPAVQERTAAGPPTIVVLPLANRTGNPAQDYLADGITQDVITALGRFSSLRVVGQRLAFSYRGYAGDTRQLGIELHARYLVEGAIRQTAAGVSLSVELTDTEAGLLLWSEQLDMPMDALPTLQQTLVQRIVGTLALKLSRTERQRIDARPTVSRDAYDLTLHARHLIDKRTRSSNSEARALLQQAIALAPAYAPAYVALAEAHNDAAQWGWREPQVEVAAARELVLKAIELDPEDARAHGLLADTYLTQREWDLAAAELERALALNPSEPEIQAEAGSLALRRGHIDEAIARLEGAFAMDPDIDPGWQDLGLAYWLTDRPADAVDVLRRGLSRRPARPLAHAILAAIAAEAGLAKLARAEADEVRRLAPFFAVDNMRSYFADTAIGSRLAAALRKAGLT